MNPILINLFLGLLLAACGSKEPESVKTAQPEHAITQAIHQPLDQAKAVEQLLQDKSEERKQQADGL